MLDRSHAILETLEGHRLAGVFHVNRLKIAWVRTDKGSVNTKSALTPKGITQIIADKTGANHLHQASTVKFKLKCSPTLTWPNTVSHMHSTMDTQQCHIQCRKSN